VENVHLQNALACRAVANACHMVAAGRQVDRATLDVFFRRLIQTYSNRQVKGSLEFLRCYYNELPMLQSKLAQFSNWSLETLYQLVMSGNKFENPSPPCTALKVASIMLHSIANNLEDLAQE